jgi:DNA polymerase-3 subunit gamma/tau
MKDNTKLALYRKYRPETFDEVVEQDHIVDVLKSSIETGKVSHAYLFVGSRGTGKTTVARIFAREIGASVNDVYEIDAASNRKVEEVRELLDGVRVLPFDSKYKVYIIDEVHMLSKESWGALLKTLEEPPKHVIFILATTELHKVPDTIISRCQVFNFKKPSQKVLKVVLENTAKKEGFELEQGISELLSILADGSFRDAHGVLQKVLNFSETKKVKRADVEEITGAPKSTLVNSLLSAISKNDLEEGIRTISNAVAENMDVKLFAKLLILKFRMVIVLRYAPKLEDEMKGDLSTEDLEFLKSLVIDGGKEAKLNSKSLAILLDAYANISNAFIPELPLELALVKIFEEK